MGEFIPTYSTDHIWREEDMEKCLSTDLNTIEANITALQSGKANTAHTHTEYASASDIAQLQTLVGDTSVSSQIATAVAGKADTNHAHTEYAATTHAHTEYAEVNHTHTGYALENHEHTGYATETFVNTQVAGLVNSAPDALNTLNELAAALGNDANFATTIATQLGSKVDKVDGQGLSTNDYTDADKNKLTAINANANESNFFSSLTDIGITTFPTTMKAVSEAMPKNSMIVIDTRRINGTESEYNTETISDWGNTANGVAMIMKGVSTARVGMMILYGTTATSSANIHYGSYAHDANNVNWINIEDDKFSGKIDKISTRGSVDLNTVTETGLYYVTSGGATDKHFPTGTNGHLLVMSDGTRVRQVFFRVGTVDTNNFQWYSRSLGSDTTAGVDADGWSQWWLLSGSEKVWNGGTVLNSEINIGSRYGCQSWVVVARLQNTGSLASVVIPRAFLVTDTTTYRFQIADEECYISFYIYYKTSDDNVYLKVVDQTDSDYTTLKYVYRMS